MGFPFPIIFSILSRLATTSKLPSDTVALGPEGDAGGRPEDDAGGRPEAAASAETTPFASEDSFSLVADPFLDFPFFDLEEPWVGRGREK